MEHTNNQEYLPINKKSKEVHVLLMVICGYLFILIKFFWYYLIVFTKLEK